MVGDLLSSDTHFHAILLRHLACESLCYDSAWLMRDVPFIPPGEIWLGLDGVYSPAHLRAILAAYDEAMLPCVTSTPEEG